jgi:hypothetical protein
VLPHCVRTLCSLPMLSPCALSPSSLTVLSRCALSLCCLTALSHYALSLCSLTVLSHCALTVLSHCALSLQLCSSLPPSFSYTRYLSRSAPSLSLVTVFCFSEIFDRDEIERLKEVSSKACQGRFQQNMYGDRSRGRLAWARFEQEGVTFPETIGSHNACLCRSDAVLDQIAFGV